MAPSKLFNKSEKENDTNVSSSRDYSQKVNDDLAAPQTTLNQEQYSDTETVGSEADEGVKKARATTIVWTRKALFVAYAL